MVIRRSLVIGEKTDTKKASPAAKPTGTVVNKAENKKIIVSGEQPLRTFNKKGKILVIVESPAKSKTIEKFLGNNYVVKASMGHLRDLPKSQLGVDIENGFTPHYANLYARRALIEELRKEADKSSGVLLATDPDREGEAISWHLATILNLDKRTQCRIVFNEITEGAVTAALAHPRGIDVNMVDAQQARRILDRLVGYKLSPLLWKKLCKGLSAGRVQSVAVRIICEREREIQAFIPEEYWSIDGIYADAEKQSFQAALTHVKGEKAAIATQEDAEKIKNDLAGEQAKVIKRDKKSRSRKSAPPFTTSTLQQEGVRKLNFGAKKIMMLAQHLYEGMELGARGHVGLITYMRTDSMRISAEMTEEAKKYILSTYGDAYYPDKPNQFGSKQKSQDAHEAIRPTSLELTPEAVKPYLGKDELKLYTLIWNRFLASQMAPQKTESITLQLQCKEYTLKAVGSKVIFKGFTEVYDEAKKEDDYDIPLLEPGTTVQNKDVKAEQHFTQPPPRYSEASLIKTLEEKGIGRPSTYAPILDTIQSRNYVEKVERRFIPTELGFAVVDFLVEHFAKLMNIDFTAQLELALDDIAAGEKTYTNVLTDFYGPFVEDLQAANEVDKVKIVAEESGEICEKCGHPMIYKYGRYGRFLACSNFPECCNTKPIVISTDVKCPKCDNGVIVERKSKRGRTFYGCSNYPTCDFTLWDKPINQECDVCHSLMVEKRYKNGQVKTFCSNENCPTREKKTKKTKKENE